MKVVKLNFIENLGPSHVYTGGTLVQSVYLTIFYPDLYEPHYFAS